MIDGHFSEFAKILEHHPLPFFHEYEIIFGVHYLHARMSDNDDIYLTRFGLPLIDHFIPPVFLSDKNWFREHAEKLEGTSSAYKVSVEAPGKPASTFVVKWNRMGTNILADDESEEFVGAEFNSPFEEFSLVMELRDTNTDRGKVVITQLPLAIYVPAVRNELWRTGREEYVMISKQTKHENEILLDMYRDYIVVYEWIEGIDAAAATRAGMLQEDLMVELTFDAEERLKQKGYTVRDRKPHHIIVRPRKNGRLAETKMKGILYALVDFELLERLPKREEERRKDRRLLYHRKQRDRFSVEAQVFEDMQFKYVTVLDVDYVYVHAESTNGRLWVIGKDADLVDFFLPERWLFSPRTRLCTSHEIFHIVTKDEIHIVSKLSKAGMVPNVDPYRKSDHRLLHFGYNTAFEEVSLALSLSRNNIRVVYPRAIYEAVEPMKVSDSLVDPRRYKRYCHVLTPDGDPAFKLGKSYIILWGFYNGLDEQLAEKDGDFLESVDAFTAFHKELITEREYLTIIRRKRRKLHKAGIQDLNLHGTHLLLSITPSGKLLRSGDGFPEVRICNFEFLKKR